MGNAMIVLFRVPININIIVLLLIIFNRRNLLIRISFLTQLRCSSWVKWQYGSKAAGRKVGFYKLRSFTAGAICGCRRFVLPRILRRQHTLRKS